MIDEAVLAVVEDLEEEALVLQVQVDGIPAIKDNGTFELAAGYRQRAKALIAGIKEKHGPEKKAKETVWRAAVKAEKDELEGPEALLTALNTRLGDYEAAQRREKAIAEARAAEEARQIEAARPKPLPGAPAPMPVVVPAKPVEMPKVAGLGFVPVYSLEEKPGGRLDLIKAVANGWGSPMVLEPNLPMLKDMVRAAKGQVEIPGYRVVETRSPRG